MSPKVLGVFVYLEDLLGAISLVKDRGGRIHTVYSPIHCEELLKAVGSRPSPVRFATLLGGIAGLLGGLALAVYTFLQWGFVTSGKPTPPAVPLVVVGFEMTILVGFLSTLVTMWILCRMPRLRLPDHYEPGFSRDRFGLLVSCASMGMEDLTSLLRQAGAEDVRRVSG